MFGLLKKCVPKYHFSKSKAKEGFCRPRYKIFPYLKEIFLQNRDKITNHVLSSDLQYTSLVAQNYHSFQINDDELRSFIVTNVDFRELDYTPQLVVEIAASLKPIIKYSESEILESIWAYTDEFHFLFKLKQLQDLEGIYFHLSKMLLVNFRTPFGHLLKHAQLIKPDGDQEMTAKNLSFRSITVPKSKLDVFTYEPQPKIKINFKKLQKSVTLLGVTDNSPLGMIALKNEMNKKKFDFFLMGLPPITKTNLVKRKPVNLIQKNHIDPELEPQQKKESFTEHSYLEFFDKYGEMALFEGILTNWYRDNLLSNDKIYSLSEEERIVYKKEMGLEEPDVLNSIMYSLTMKKDPDFKVLLTDIDVVEEASAIAQMTDLESIESSFEYARQVWLQEMIRWGIKVNKSGCLKCTKSHKALPRNLMSLISRGRFNFALREKYIAKQINEAIRNCEGHKSFIGLYEDHMLYGILKHICNLNSEEVVLEGSSTVDMSQDKNETLFKHFLTKENQSERFKSATMKKEFTEKFSMILSILSLSDRKMNINIHNLSQVQNLDQDYFKQIHQKHRDRFRLDSFINKPIKVFHEPGSIPCFAEDVIFDKLTL